MFVFKEHVKIVKMYMVKFNVAILDRLKIMGGFISKRQIQVNNVNFNNPSRPVPFWKSY